MAGKSVFFHVQHLLGIGHLKRAATLCRALAAAGFEVTLASGGQPVEGLSLKGLNFVQLPPMSAADVSFKLLLDENHQPISEPWKRKRKAALLEAWRAARAQVLVIELFPFGRRQLRFELLPLLEQAGEALVLCSVRDLLQSRPSREAEALELLERYFDHVLVHGDPRIALFEHSFGAAARIAGRLHYTGYVVDEPPQAIGEAGRGEVLVSAGGGAVGRRLLEAAIRARPLTRLRGLTWRVLAGVNADYLEELQRLAPPGIVVEQNRQDFTTLLRNCELSISQAGYNTVVETLQAGARAVVVPFSDGNEAEQGLRARLLAERGLLERVEASGLAPEALAAAVERAAGRPRPAAHDIDLDGARRSAELVRQWTS